MIPILFFLLFVAGLGVFVYIYLRKEQDKLSFSNKYSAAEVEFAKTNEKSFKGLSAFLRSFKNNFANRLFSALLFIGTYIAAMILTLIVLAVLYNPTLPMLMLLFFPVALFEFPLGLVALLTQHFDVSQNETTLSITMVYLSILLLAMFADKRSFMFLYMLFVVLLIMNIAGCSISAPIIMSNIN